jgi:glutamine cyclotransferase
MYLFSLFLLLSVLSCEHSVPSQEFRIIRTFPHDSQAYTQGLLFRDGVLYESTGRYGSSSVRRVDLQSGEVLSIHELSDEYFGEGLAMVGRTLIQLTWKSELAFVYDADSLALEGTHTYAGEGWGLCFDGEALYMSNGSDRLIRRNPETFEVLDEIQVTKEGLSVPRLNELECVGDHIFANVYQSDRILRIDKRTGRVVSEIDAYRLSVASERAADPEAVLNGIAYDPATGHLFVTGKLWSDLFEIELEGG